MFLQLTRVACDVKARQVLLDKHNVHQVEWKQIFIEKVERNADDCVGDEACEQFEQLGHTIRGLEPPVITISANQVLQPGVTEKR